MRDRQPVDELLTDPQTPAELEKQLKTAGQILEFAETELDLSANGSYSSYVEVNDGALVWNVVAAGEFSLKPKQWCFPVAGCVPYRGYFNKTKAEDFAAGLRNKGLDVYISPSAAYSSLGWFHDPLLSTMFNGSDTRLAGLLFHELAHQRIYVKNDGAFNEGFASFVEQTGLNIWMDSTQTGEQIRLWEESKSATTDFTGLIAQTRDRLDELYGETIPDEAKRQQKADILLAFENAYHELKISNWNGRDYYANWFDRPVNNARLALYNTYEGSLCAFQNLLHSADGDLRAFYRLAKEKSRLSGGKREEWLDQSCTAIAPTGNL